MFPLHPVAVYVWFLPDSRDEALLFSWSMVFHYLVRDNVFTCGDIWDGSTCLRCERVSAWCMQGSALYGGTFQILWCQNICFVSHSSHLLYGLALWDCLSCKELVPLLLGFPLFHILSPPEIHMPSGRLFLFLWYWYSLSKRTLCGPSIFALAVNG